MICIPRVRYRLFETYLAAELTHGANIDTYCSASNASNMGGRQAAIELELQLELRRSKGGSEEETTPRCGGERIGRQIQSKPALPIWTLPPNCSGFPVILLELPRLCKRRYLVGATVTVLDGFSPTRPRPKPKAPRFVPFPRAILRDCCDPARPPCLDYCMPAHECMAVAITTITGHPHPLQNPARLGLGVVGLVMRRRNDIRSSAGTVSTGAKRHAARVPLLMP